MRYNRYILTICIAAITFVFAACSDNTMDSQYGYVSQFTVDAQSEYNLPMSSAPDINFNINSYSPWRVESDSEWCKPSPASSTVSSLVSSVNVETDDNLGYTVRTATLIITADDDSIEPVKILVNQGETLLLDYEGFERSFVKEGESLEFKIFANRAWRAKVEDDWLSLDRYESSDGVIEGEIISAKADPNTSVERQTTITIESESGIIDLVVTQLGATFSFAPLDSDEHTLELAQIGGVATYDVVVDSDIEWDVKSDNLGITAKRLSATQIEVSAGINMFADRIANIVLVASDGNESEPLVVTQLSNITIEGDVVINEDGSMEISKTDDTSARYLTNDRFKYGTFVWTFTDVSLSGGSLDIYARAASPDNGNYELILGSVTHVGTLPNGYGFRSGGTIGGKSIYSAPSAFTFADDKLMAMRTLEYTIIPNPSKAGTLYIEAKVDGEVIYTTTTLVDPWYYSPSSEGTAIEFGIVSAAAIGSVRVTSCTYTPYEVE